MYYRMVLVGLAAMLTAGCATDRPQEYGRQRPPVDQLDARDRGLQSKDVVSATDQLAMDLLAAPKLNASRTTWTMVVVSMENKTTDPRFNYDIFIERLRGLLARHGGDRITLIENRDRYRDLQAKELEHGARPQDAGIQPDYALYGKVMELPNRGTSYYLMDFTITNLQTRQQVWSGQYEVRVDR